MHTQHIFNIIEPIGIKPAPDRYERRVANLVANHFLSDIKFVMRTSSTTPDLEVLRLRQFWEIKNIKGNGKNTIHNNLKNVDRQSENVIISLLRSKMQPKEAASRAKEHLSA